MASEEKHGGKEGRREISKKKEEMARRQQRNASGEKHQPISGENNEMAAWHGSENKEIINLRVVIGIENKHQ